MIAKKYFVGFPCRRNEFYRDTSLKTGLDIVGYIPATEASSWPPRHIIAAAT